MARTVRRPRPRWFFLTLTAFTVLAAAARGQGLRGQGGGFLGFGLGFYAPSYYGYDLDAQTGYYGGSRYREYYSYGRGTGLANFPGPVPGPMYREPYVPPAFRPKPPPAVWRLPPEEGPPPNVAQLVVQVPDGAEVWLDDQRMHLVGPSRKYLSPPLPLGQSFAWQVRARWTQDGQVVEHSQRINFQAGDRLTLAFPLAPTEGTLPAPRLLPQEILLP